MTVHPCIFCGRPYAPGHYCEEGKQARKAGARLAAPKKRAAAGALFKAKPLDYLYVPKVGDIISMARTLTDSLSTSTHKWIVRVIDAKYLAMWCDTDSSNFDPDECDLAYWRRWSSLTLFKSVWIDSLHPEHSEAIACRNMTARGCPSGHTLTLHPTLNDALEYIGLPEYTGKTNRYVKAPCSAD